jgi:hypothetical protein
MSDNDNYKLFLHPVCGSCGCQANKLIASFLNSRTGRIDRIYKCQCGRLVRDRDE